MTYMSQQGKSMQVTRKVIQIDVQSHELQCAALQTKLNKLNLSKRKTSIINLFVFYYDVRGIIYWILWITVNNHNTVPLKVNQRQHRGKILSSLSTSPSTDPPCSVMGGIYDTLEPLGGTSSLCHAATIYQSQQKLKGQFSMYSTAGFYFGRGSFHFVYRPPTLSVLV